MTVNSRAKGRRVQTEGLALLRQHGWDVHERPGGQDGDDCAAIDPQGDWWSVEIKGAQTASLRELWRQTRTQATVRGDRYSPLLLWRIDRGGWWCVVSLATIGEQWVDCLGGARLDPPASMALPAIARWLVRANAAPLPTVHLPGSLAAMPAWDALAVVRGDGLRLYIEGTA